MSDKKERDTFAEALGITLNDEGKRIINLTPPVDALILIINFGGQYVIQPPTSAALKAYVGKDIVQLDVLYNWLKVVFDDFELLGNLIAATDDYIEERKNRPVNPLDEN